MLVGIVILIVVIFIVYIISKIYFISKKGPADPHDWYIPPIGSKPISGLAPAAVSEKPLSDSSIDNHKDSIPWLVDRLKTASSLDKNQIEELLVNKGAASVDTLIKAMPPDGELPEMRELIFRILARIGDRTVEKVFLQGLVDRNQVIRFWSHYGMRESVGGFCCP
jgi:hypothetical protein